MPRRKAAQNAASKISDIADKENDGTLSRNTKSNDADRTANEPVVKAGRKKRIIQDERTTSFENEQEKVLSPKEFNEENKREKTIRVTTKRRKAKKALIIASTDSAATNKPDTEDRKTQSLQNKGSHLIKDTELDQTMSHNQAQTENTEPKKDKNQSQTGTERAEPKEAKGQSQNESDTAEETQAENLKPKKNKVSKQTVAVDTETIVSQNEVNIEPKKLKSRRGNYKGDIESQKDTGPRKPRSKPSNIKEDTESTATQSERSISTVDMEPKKPQSKRRKNKEESESRTLQSESSNNKDDIEPKSPHSQKSSNKEKAEPKAKRGNASKENPQVNSRTNTENKEADNQIPNEDTITKTKSRPTRPRKKLTRPGENAIAEKSAVGSADFKPGSSLSDETTEVSHLPEVNEKVLNRPRKGRQIKEISTVQIEENIQAVRLQISHWWEMCFYGKEQKKLCLPFFDESMTSSNLSALKKEEAKLRKYYEKNRHIFENITLQRDDNFNGKLHIANTEYEMKLLAKDKEVQENQLLHKEILQQLEFQLQEKECRISQLEKNIQEMQSQQSKLQKQSQEKDDNITALRKSLESFNTTYTKENDSVFENSKCQQRSNNEIKEDFHEVDVLHEFCQKQKKTIRSLEQEIEQMRRERIREENSSSIPE